MLQFQTSSILEPALSWWKENAERGENPAGEKELRDKRKFKSSGFLQLKNTKKILSVNEV